MLIREFNLRHQRNLPETVLYAGDFLEHIGFIFMIDFGVLNAIDIASTEYTKWLDDLYYWELNG
jgi:hypothetical protein